MKNKRHHAEQQKEGFIVKVTIGLVKRFQYAWAKWMTLHTSEFSAARWKITLALFVLLMTAGSTAVIVRSLLLQPPKAIALQTLSKPLHLAQTGDRHRTDDGLATQEYERIHAFCQYMDSLSATYAGRKLYDSILARHPGLLDSARFIAKYYQQSKQK